MAQVAASSMVTNQVFTTIHVRTNRLPSNPPPDRSRPRRRDAVRNRELLVEAAHAVFAARGFEASMDDIARHAGLGVGTAYRHFANKYELANAIFDTAVEAYVDSAVDAMTTSDPWQALAGVLERTFEAQTENRAIREILLGVRQEDAGHHDTMLAPLVPLFDRAKAAGLVRDDAEFSDVGMLIVMLCRVAEASVDQSPYLWRRYLPTLLLALRPGGGPFPVPALTAEQLHEALAERGPLTPDEPVSQLGRMDDLS
jgi:AcrR family transcriptional regulator